MNNTKFKMRVKIFLKHRYETTFDVAPMQQRAMGWNQTGLCDAHVIYQVSYRGDPPQNFHTIGTYYIT